MRGACLVLLIASATACASSSHVPDVAPPSQRTVAVDDQQVYRTTVLANPKANIPAAPSRVFDALKGVYEELGVPSERIRIEEWA